MSIEKDITKALQEKGIAAATASTLNTLEIKAIGREFNPPNDQKYIEFVQIRNNNNGRYWNGSRVYQGIFRLLIHWPIDNKGDYEILDHMDSLSNQFTKNEVLVSGLASVKIYEEPNLGDTIPNGQERIFPLSLLYRCFASS